MSRNIGANPPLIQGTDNLASATVQSLQVQTLYNTSNVGFFGTIPQLQQSGAPTRNASGQKTADSDRKMTLSLLNTLNNYGLISFSTVYPNRTLTFTNQTTNSPALELYVTVGGVGNTLTSLGVFPTSEPKSIVYDIPTEIGWTGNFQVWPVGLLPTNQLGATLFEISVNDQVYNDATNPPTLLPLRDNWDISTVPPNIPVPQLDCGPRDQAVAASYLPISNPGYGYFPGNKLATSGGSGSGLTIDLITVSGGSITYPTCIPPYNTPGIGGYKIRDFGIGYTTSDVVTVLQPMAITIQSGGTGYTTSATPSATTSATGSGLTIYVLETSSGVITSAGVGATGSGYNVGDTVTILGGGANATINIISTTLANTGTLARSILSRSQSQMYNVGMQVIPPAPPTDTVTFPPLQNPGPYWPPITVIANNLDGNCAQSITYPNDTALPKSQVGYAQGSYTINIVDPTVVELA